MGGVTDFLLELRSEEIPARMQVKAKDDLARLFAEEIAKAGLTATAIETFATPRRLALIARGLPDETEATRHETKGPRVGAPEQALDGFLRRYGLTRDRLVERDGVYFAERLAAGRPTTRVLQDAIPDIIRAFPWPKSMRWGASSQTTESLRWVRPLQGIVALFGDTLVPCEVDGIASGAATMGHRFHHSGPVTIGSAADYVEQLRAAHVIVHLSERTTLIRDGARAAAVAAGLVLVEDEGLVLENAGLTEWPVPLLGRFDPDFLGVPREVIQLTMRTNQKYFACTDASGALANAFVCTANIAASDGGTAIIAGNRKVLAARLSDAKFFWENDLKVPLATQAEKLSQIVFHEKLGTVADKVERVAKLARWLVESGVIPPSPSGGRDSSRLQREQKEGLDARSVPASTPHPLPGASRLSLPPEGEGGGLADLAETAARLCKADLVTGMVGEFPELQGIIGGHLARAQGLPDAVADAIRDHYKPVGQGDDVPTDPVTVAVSLADKLDTIAAFFGIHQQPTGSKDPFALRRAALGVLRILIENDVRLSLTEIASRYTGVERLPASRAESAPMLHHLRADLIVFFADRLKFQQKDRGVRHDVIDAATVLSFVRPGQSQLPEDDLVRLLARVKALQAFVGTAEGANLLAGYKRAANILKKEGVAATSTRHPELVSGSTPPPGTPSQAEGWTLKQVRGDGIQAEEAALAAALDTAEPLAAAAIEAEDFAAAMTALATLRTPIDAFFENVTVNDPDPTKRTARLALLTRFRDAVHRVADFSKIEG